MIKYLILPLLLLNFGCLRRGPTDSSSVNADGTCSASIDRLNADCWFEIMKRLTDEEILTSLREMSVKNPILRKELFDRYGHRVPEWRRTQIKEDLAKVGSRGGTQSGGLSPNDRYQNEVIRNFAEFFKSILNVGKGSVVDPNIFEPLVTMVESKSQIVRSHDQFISDHVAVYQDRESKIVGISTITGQEIFSYDTKGQLAEALAPIGKGRFLSAHKSDIFLWSLDPKIGKGKPLSRWEPPSRQDCQDPIKLIVMNPDFFAATTERSARVFKLSSPEPKSDLKGERLDLRLHKMNKDELFIAPKQWDMASDTKWVPEFLNVNSGKIRRIDPIEIGSGKTFVFEVASDSKIIIDAKNPDNKSVQIYDKNNNNLLKLSDAASVMDVVGDSLVFLRESDTPNHDYVYDLRTGKKTLSNNEQLRYIYNFHADYYIAQPMGTQLYISSRYTNWSQAGRYDLQLYFKDSHIIKASDQGVILLRNMGGNMRIVNFWVNVAKKLAQPVKS